MLSIRSKVLSTSLFACAVLSSAFAMADTAKTSVDTRIAKVEEPSFAGAPYQVLAADGRVFSVQVSNQVLAEELDKTVRSGAPLHLTVKGSEIVSFAEMTADEAKAYVDPIGDMSPEELAASIEGQDKPIATIAQSNASQNSAVPAPIAEFQRRQGYQPTILNSMEEAHQLYLSERPLDHKSQCHERAMVWTHDMYVNRGIRSMKVMMFYTPRFRNTFLHKSGVFGDTYEPYKWWYHTAPVVYVGNQPVVLDSEFVDHEMTLDDWSRFFLVDEIFPNDRNIPYSNVTNLHLTQQETHCRVMSNFREYAIPTLRDPVLGKSSKMDPFYSWQSAHTSGDWCMMRIYPMYYMQPADIARMDCDPSQDSNYTLGLTGEGRFHPAIGTKVLDSRLNDGRFKYACSPLTITDFRKEDLDIAYSHASERK